MDNDIVEVKLPKDCIQAFIVAGNNYINRIKHLEDTKRISDYKLRRIKNTNLYDLKHGMKILEQYSDR